MKMLALAGAMLLAALGSNQPMPVLSPYAPITAMVDAVQSNRLMAADAQLPSARRP